MHDGKRGLSASLEDYLEAILNVAGSDGVARCKDIARSLGVAKPSVTGALRVLAARGLVNYRPYGYVTLTEGGRAQAERIAGKHDIIKSFFVDILGVNNEAAHSAACGAEHSLGPEVVSRLSAFTRFIHDISQSDGSMAARLQLFKSGGRRRRAGEA